MLGGMLQKRSLIYPISAILRSENETRYILTDIFKLIGIEQWIFSSI